MTKQQLEESLELKQFPRSSKYDPEWMCRNEMGPNSIWLTEFLTHDMNLQAGMKVLDMGCGKVMSSIFLAKEYGVHVWATDLWISATDNLKRIQAAGVEDLVYPIHAEAHALPYAEEFFDAIVSVDAYHYFGTNEIYLLDFIKFLKPEGQIGIVVPGLQKEFDDEIPERLTPYWDPELYSLHTPAWWKKMWARTGAVEVDIADSLPDGWNVWITWETAAKESGLGERHGDIDLLTADGGEYFRFTRVIAHRKP